MFQTFASCAQVWIIAVGYDKWMLLTSYKKLQAVFSIVAKSLAEGSVKDQVTAWRKFNNKFLALEVGKRVDHMNIWVCCPHPVAEVQLEIFEGKSRH